jgi:hypothetical protein
MLQGRPQILRQFVLLSIFAVWWKASLVSYGIASNNTDGECHGILVGRTQPGQEKTNSKSFIYQLSSRMKDGVSYPLITMVIRIINRAQLALAMEEFVVLGRKNRFHIKRTFHVFP